MSSSTTDRVATRKPGRPPDPKLRAERRQQILDAAARIFAADGYSGADLDVVAQRAGIAKATIYLYFDSKHALFLATVDDAMRQLTEATNAVRSQVRDPIDVIPRAVRAYLEFFDSQPHVVELLIQERAQFKDRKTPTYFEMKEANAGPWRDLVRQLIEAGRIREMPVDRVLDVVGDMLYGTMFTNYFSGRRRSVDEQCRDVLDIMYRGILSDSERALDSPTAHDGQPAPSTCAATSQPKLADEPSQPTNALGKSSCSPKRPARSRKRTT